MLLSVSILYFSKNLFLLFFYAYVCCRMALLTALPVDGAKPRFAYRHLVRFLFPFPPSFLPPLLRQGITASLFLWQQALLPSARYPVPPYLHLLWRTFLSAFFFLPVSPVRNPAALPAYRLARAKSLCSPYWSACVNCCPLLPSSEAACRSGRLSYSISCLCLPQHPCSPCFPISVSAVWMTWVFPAAASPCGSRGFRAYHPGGLPPFAALFLAPFLPCTAPAFMAQPCA